jgi:hypothetical protein
MIQQPDTSQYDRITQILREQSGQSFNQIDPAMMNAQFSANAMNPSAFLQGLQQAQQRPLQNEQSILSIFEAKKAAGDATVNALDKRISLFTGDDPQGKALFLEELHSDPDEIDPNNSYQVMTKLASIAKRTGYQAPTSQQAIKAQSDVGKVAADYRAGLIDEAAYRGALGQVGKPKLTANDQKELINAKKTIIAAPNAEKKIQEALGLNEQAFSGSGIGLNAKTYLARKTGTFNETLANTTKLSNITMRNVLNSLKTTFGGLPTEGERKVLIDVESAIGGTEEERRAVLEQALESVKNKKTESQQLIDIIEGAAGASVRGENAAIDDYSGLSDEEIIQQLGL